MKIMLNESDIKNAIIAYLESTNYEVGEDHNKIDITILPSPGESYRERIEASVEIGQ